MDDSAQPSLNSLTVEQLREYIRTLGEEVIEAFDAFYLLTGVTVVGASFTGKARDVSVGEEELTRFSYETSYEFSFDYEPVLSE